MLIGLVAAVLLLLFLDSTRRNRQAIAAARVQATQLENARDSLVGEVESREQQQAALISARALHEAQIVNLRASVAQLERARASRQLGVRQIRTSGQLLDRLRATFPELGDSAWGLSTVHSGTGDTLGIEYLMVPAWFAETFAIDHANARSWEAQKDQLLTTDSLRLVVAVLQDSIIRLETANALAYQTGYETAYANYQTLSDTYIAELARPRINIGPAVGLLGAISIGFFIGKSIR